MTGSPGGFTLVEIVVVVAIIAISAAIAIPAVQSGQHQRQVRGTLQHFVAAVREASSKAVLTRRTVELWISPDESNYALALPVGRDRALEAEGATTEGGHEPDDLELEEARRIVGRVELPELASFGEVKGGRALRDEMVAIPFYPTGASSGGEIEFVFERRNSKQTYVITIDPLTSDVDLKEDS
jgi:prepilin-type N-terminal cleavage/methylation domain-containing protein